MDYSDESPILKTNTNSILTIEQTLLHEEIYSNYLILPICRVCELESSDFVTIPGCLHKFCKPCVETYFTLKVEQAQIENIKCLDFECKTEINPLFLIQFLEHLDILKYKKFARRNLIEKKENYFYCPAPDCEGYCYREGFEKNLVCSVCKFEFCLKCRFKSHEGSCKKNENEKKFINWLEENDTKFCPKCLRKIEKNGGCPRMRCIKCEYIFCWICGADLNYHTNNFRCMIGFSYFDLYWDIIVFLFFFPLLIPFIFFITFIRNYENLLAIRRIRILTWIFKKKFIVYPTVFLLSPLFELIYLLIIGFVLGFSLITSSSCFRRKFFFKIIVGLPLFLIISTLLECLILVLLTLFTLISPFLAIFFFVPKIYYFFKRKNEPGRNYPRFFLSFLSFNII